MARMTITRQPRAARNVGQLEQFLSALSGLVLAWAALARRRSLLGRVELAAAAVLLLRRAVTGRSAVYRGLGISSTNGDAAGSVNLPLRVEHAVILDRPVDAIYALWRNLDNLAPLLPGIESITKIGNGTTRWVARGPLGSRLAWDAEIVNEVPGRVISWRSLPGADVEHAGSVLFRPLGGAALRSPRSLRASDAPWRPARGRGPGHAGLSARPLTQIPTTALPRRTTTA